MLGVPKRIPEPMRQSEREREQDNKKLKICTLHHIRVITERRQRWDLHGRNKKFIEDFNHNTCR